MDRNSDQTRTLNDNDNNISSTSELVEGKTFVINLTFGNHYIES